MPGEAATVTTDEPDLDLPDLRQLMTKAVDSTSQDDGWASLLSRWAATSATPTRRSTTRNYNFPKLSSLARAQDYLEVKQAGSGSNAMRVRIKPVATTKTTAPASGHRRRRSRPRSSSRQRSGHDRNRRGTVAVRAAWRPYTRPLRLVPR